MQDKKIHQKIVKKKIEREREREREINNIFMWESHT